MNNNEYYYEEVYDNDWDDEYEWKDNDDWEDDDGYDWSMIEDITG